MSVRARDDVKGWRTVAGKHNDRQIAEATSGGWAAMRCRHGASEAKSEKVD